MQWGDATPTPVQGVRLRLRSRAGFYSRDAPGALSVELEDSPDVVERLHQPVDLLARVVDGEARPGGRRHPEPIHQDLRAVVAGANADRVAVEDLGDVVAVNALELEGDDAGAVVPERWPEDAQARDLAEALQRVCRELDLVRVCRVQADCVEPLDGRRQTNRLPDGRRPALELRWEVRPRDLVAANGADHRAAADEGRHVLEQLPAPVERPDARRAVHLVGGERVEVGA